MTRNGIIDCISLIKENYDYCNYSEKEFASILKLWEFQFKGYDDEIVLKAVMNIISLEEKKPTIASIKKGIANLMVVVRNDSEVWNLVYSAARNSSYSAGEEWAALPEDIRVVVSPDYLREVARSSNNDLPFLRKEILNNYHSLMERRQRSVMLPYSNEDGVKSIGHDPEKDNEGTLS